MSKSPWTAERVATLKKLWGEGHTASRIAKLMSDEEYTFTTNAIIGKRSRMKLSARKRYGTKARIPRNKNGGVPMPCRGRSVKVEDESHTLLIAHEVAKTDAGVAFEIIAPPSLVPVLIGSTNVSGTSSLEAILKIRDSQCKWPIGDPTSLEFSFCAKAALANGSYCPEHDELAHQPVQQAVPRKYIKRIA